MTNFADDEGYSDWLAEHRGPDMTLAEAIADEHAAPPVTHVGRCYFRLDDGERCQNGWYLDEHEKSADRGWICPNDAQRRESA